MITLGDLPGRDGKGTYYIVTGGGGAPLDAVSNCGFGAFTRSAYEFVRVMVNEQHAILEAVGPDGKVIDRFEINKRR